jgi:nitronate monooxygenase
MWPRTRILDLFSLQHPIILAPMAGACTPQLVAGVSDAGGLGSLGAALMTTDQMRSAIRETRRLTNRAFNVNVQAYEVPPPEPAKIEAMRGRIQGYIRNLGAGTASSAPMPQTAKLADQIAIALEEKVPIFSWTYGIPDAAALKALKANGTKLIGTATAVEEARQLEAAGVDAIVAQGFEAGGHRGSFAVSFDESMVGTFALVPQIVDAVRIPVIAAGGIMDGRGIAAALMLGAEGVQMGTAFLACPENAIHPLYRQTLISGAGGETTFSRAYSGRPARWIRNRFIDEMNAIDDQIPEYPHQISLAAPLRAAAGEKNSIDFLPMLAGQAYRMSRAMPAGELVQTLVREAADLFVGARPQ